VSTLIHTLKARDLATEQHASRLEKLLVRMAALIGLPESTTADLSLLAKFHDIGRVRIRVAEIVGIFGRDAASRPPLLILSKVSYLRILDSLCKDL